MSSVIREVVKGGRVVTVVLRYLAHTLRIDILFWGRAPSGEIMKSVSKTHGEDGVVEK